MTNQGSLIFKSSWIFLAGDLTVPVVVLIITFVFVKELYLVNFSVFLVSLFAFFNVIKFTEIYLSESVIAIKKPYNFFFKERELAIKEVISVELSSFKSYSLLFKIADKPDLRIQIIGTDNRIRWIFAKFLTENNIKSIDI